MYANVEEVFETRQRDRARRLEQERRDEEQRRREGQGTTTPLAAVPELDRYLFDLQGYFIIRKAVGDEQLRAINAYVDERADGKDYGISAEEAQRMMADPHDPAGKDLQQGFGGGDGGRSAGYRANGANIGGDPIFDCLIDHPSWITHMREFVNGDDTVMTPGGGGVLHRWPGQASGAHGGGGVNRPGSAGFVWDQGEDEETGRFRCQVVSVLLALNDCPEGGGNTFAVVRSPTQS